MIPIPSLSQRFATMAERLYNRGGVESVQMNLIAALLLSHLVGDFPLQTNQIYRLKNRSWFGIVLHAGIHVVVAALLIRQPLMVWPMLVWLGVLHFLIDLIKLRVSINAQWLGFLVDQVAHLLVLWLLARIWSTATTSILPVAVLMPLIAYGLFLAIAVFFWVLANELSGSTWGNQRDVRWASNHLLTLSQYAGLPLLLILTTYLYQQITRSP
jgi:hypothetical protein